MPFPPNRKYRIGSGAGAVSACLGASESPPIGVAADGAAAGVALPAAAGVVPTGDCDEANAVEADDAPGDTPAIDLGTSTDTSKGHNAGSLSMAGVPPSVLEVSAATVSSLVKKNAGPKVPGWQLLVLDSSMDTTWPENISLRI